jgi:hypothetical protein
MIHPKPNHMDDFVLQSFTEHSLRFFNYDEYVKYVNIWNNLDSDDREYILREGWDKLLNWSEK